MLRTSYYITTHLSTVLGSLNTTYLITTMTDFIDQLFPNVSKPLWADIPLTPEEEKDRNDYLTIGEGAELMAAVMKEIAHLRNERLTAQLFSALNILPAMQGTAPKKRGVSFGPAIVMAPAASAAAAASTAPADKTNTLILHNIPRDVTEQELRAEFDSYGTIQRVAIPIDKNRRSPHFGGVRGFAILEFASASEAEAALTQENGRLTIRGKTLSIEYSKK